MIVAPKTSASTLQQLCPIAMFPDNCDFTSFNADESCCPSTVALDAQYRFTETEGNDVNDHCCVDDMNASPFIVRFAGVESRGADTAFRFQLSRKAVTSYIDLDGNAANRSCSNMALDDFGIAIYKDLDVKYVAFNGSVALWKIVRTGANPDAIWVNIAPKLAGSAITRQQPLDVLIVVAGAVTDLCPASKYMRAKNTCEISLHGTDPTGWCCPHGLTRTAPPPDECCVDDLDHSPYRLTLDGSVVSADSTEYTFRVSTTEVECVTDSHARDTGACDKHSIQSSKLAIFDKVSVQSVTVNGAAASFSTEPATSYSKWLKIEHSDVYYADFQEGAPMTIKVVVAGTVRELCPAQAAFGTQKPVCEFSLHGLQSRTQCCPHGVSFSA